MNKYILIFILSVVCIYKVEAQSDSVHKNKTKIITAEQFAKMNLNYCDTFSLEITGFYPIVRAETGIDKDTIHLVRVLKRLGWKTIEGGGWGNWQNGPRSFEVDMKKGDCYCSVIKLYYNYKKMKDGYYSMKVNEKIFCNKKFSYLEE